MIKPIFKLIQALQSNISPAEIAAGAVFGLFWGLTPWKSTHIIILVLCFFFFKVNRAATLVIIPLVKLLDVLALRMIADSLGLYLLTDVSVLQPVFSVATDLPVLALMNFNHTRVLGGYCLSVILAPFVFIVVTKLVVAYRNGLKDKIDNLKIVKWLKGLFIFRWIASWWPK